MAKTKSKSKPKAKRMGMKGKRSAGKARAKYNNNTFSTTCRWVADLYATTGVTVDNYVSFDMTPLSGASAVYNTRDYTVWSKVFDQYRITSATVTFTSRANVFDIGSLASETVPYSEASTNYLFSAFDRDSAVPTNLQAIQTLRSCSKHNILKTFTRSYRFKYPNNTWIDTDSSTPKEIWKACGLEAHYGIYGENLPFPSAFLLQSNPIGSIQVVYHVVFRGQRLVNVGLDKENNQVVLGTPEPDMKVPSNVTVRSGMQNITTTPLDNECDDV